jgi:hypothetical protein
MKREKAFLFFFSVFFVAMIMLGLSTFSKLGSPSYKKGVYEASKLMTRGIK